VNNQADKDAAKLARHARLYERGGHDLGEKYMMRPAFHAPPEVWEKIKMRYPDIDQDNKEFAKWFNSSASEYYSRFKTRERI